MMLLLFTAVRLALQAPAPPVLWAGLVPGEYLVGYQSLPGLSPESSVWYPATGGGTPMTYRAYLGRDADGFSAFLTSAGLPTRVSSRYLESPMAAVRDARPVPGSFPIVMVAQGNGHQAADQAVLCEYLASHGYLVVTTTSPMVATPMTREDEVGPFAERQAGDLMRAADAVAAWPTADAGVRFSAGHSFGARAALLVAMRDARVRGVISLDGGIGTATAVTSYRAAPSFAAARATAAILHFYEELDEQMAPDFALLRSLPMTPTLRRVPGLHHIHFTTLGFASSAFPELRGLTKGGDELPESMRTVARDVLAFLDRLRTRRLPLAHAGAVIAR